MSKFYETPWHSAYFLIKLITDFSAWCDRLGRGFKSAGLGRGGGKSLFLFEVRIFKKLLVGVKNIF